MIAQTRASGVRILLKREANAIHTVIVRAVSSVMTAVNAKGRRMTVRIVQKMQSA